MPPTMLLQTLEGLRRKVKLFGIVFGVGLVIACAVALLLFTVLVDYYLNLPAVPRVVLIALCLAGVGYALTRWVLKPALGRLSLGDLAGRLEGAFPQFNDRLRSTVNFIQGKPIPGSEGMKHRVVTEAAQMAQSLNLDAAIYTKPVWYSASAGMGALLLIIALSLIVNAQFPGFVGIATSRLLTPFNGQPWPKSVQIQLIGDVPRRVPVGQRVDLKMHLTKGTPRRATILYRYDDGPWQEQLMTPGEGKNYTAALDTRIDPSKTAGSLQIKIRAGDDEMLLEPVAIVPRLDVAHIEARITPPAYAGRDVSTVVLSERPAVLAAGATVDLVIDFNKPLDMAQPVDLALVTAAEPAKQPPTTRPAEEPRPLAVIWERPLANRATAHLAPGHSLRFNVHATDTDNFQNTNGQEYELIVRDDILPTVQIEEPRRSEDRTPNAEFDIKASAEDDYGIDAVQLVVQRLGGESVDKNAPDKNKWVIDLVKGATAVPQPGINWTRGEDKAERKRFGLGHHWKLDSLGALKPGDVLEYFIQVKDNYKLNSNEHSFVPSGRLRITIISQDQWTAVVQQRMEQIHQELTQIRQGELRTKQDTDTLAKGTLERQKFDDADKTATERLVNQQGTTASQTVQAAQKLRDLAQRMQENKSPDGGAKQAAQDVAKQLEQTSDGPMKDATKNLNQAKDQPIDPKAAANEQKQKAAQQASTLGKASDKEQQSADQLESAMKKLGDFGTLPEIIQKLQEIRKEQEALSKKFNDASRQTLGKKPEELTKQQKDQLEELSKQQANLQKRMEALLSDLQKKSEQTQKSDPPTSESMKQSAQAGQNVPGQQQQSAKSMQQNQQAQAQNAQKQVDLGIEMMLQKLKEAERRKLEELAKQLEEVQKLVAELIRRQAGHNLDNLAIQDPKKIKDMETVQRDELLVQANRELDKLPAPPTVPQLSASQEQTERNTRDIAKTTEALPDPAPSSRLTEAAGHMERAIVHLRDSKLPDAYEPPQVNALKALADAKEAIDKKLNEVKKDLESQDQESIRQAYVKLLEKQQKLDEETIKIDGTQKDPAGSLPREVAVRLGQLPGIQGELARIAGELGEKLSALKSVVYVWANKDIVRSMDEVKDDLAKPVTGKPTQAEQARIEEQLQAMIASLVQTKKQGKFEDPKNGGGGGGQCECKVAMPSEAELRLLKQLQEAVNKSTKTIDAEKVKDNEKLLALGGRQGELRGLLDRLLQQSSGGKLKLDAEPDNKNQLPEEADDQAIEDQELEKELVEGKVEEETLTSNVKLTGDRMARSRQRLALNTDPGKTTQKIQERILKDMDLLIDLAKKQQAQMANGKPKPGPKQGPPKPGDPNSPQKIAKATPKPGTPKTGGQTPAVSETPSGSGDPEADLRKEIQEKATEWGGLSQRVRQAVVESGGETVIKKYQKLVDDYYLTLSKKAAER